MATQSRPFQRGILLKAPPEMLFPVEERTRMTVVPVWPLLAAVSRFVIFIARSFPKTAPVVFKTPVVFNWTAPAGISFAISLAFSSRSLTSVFSVIVKVITVSTHLFPPCTELRQLFTLANEFQELKIASGAKRRLGFIAVSTNGGRT
jgi:hypothetical protein